MTKEEYIEDHLNEDTELPSQKFVCLSFLTPESIKSDNEFAVRGVKIRGVYNDYESAEKRAKHLRNVDKIFNVYIGEVGKWLAFCDNAEYANEEDYANKELNKLMKNYKEEQEKASTYHEERKQTMVNKANKDVENKKNKQVNKNEDVMLDKTLNSEIDDLDLKNKQQKEEMDKVRQIINDKENEINLLSQEYNKVQEELNNKKEDKKE